MYSDLLVATAEGGDHLLDPTVYQVLHLLRERLQMDVVFVREQPSQLASPAEQARLNQPVLDENGCNAVEADWARRLLLHRVTQLRSGQSGLTPMGKPLGKFFFSPVQLEDGSAFGTLCSFIPGSNKALHARELKNLCYTAKLIASKMAERKRREQLNNDDSRWSLEPQESTFRHLL